MKKIAIFVEGQTEKIFVREFLLRLFQWNSNAISLECFNLFRNDDLENSEYPFPDVINENSDFYFQILNIGNDKSVLSRMKNREKYYWSLGFDKIIGLRDMYSKDYRKISTIIDKAVNQEFISNHQSIISENFEQPEKVKFIFAIMEIETWFLALSEILPRIDIRMNRENIKSTLGYDLELIDPQSYFFQPAKDLNDIFGLANRKYDKHKGDIEHLMRISTKEDFENLWLKDKCNSYKEFYNTIDEICN